MDKEDAIILLDNSIQYFYNAKLILLDQAVRDFLDAILPNDIIFETIENANCNFSFSEVYRISTTINPEEGFVMPPKHNIRVALVTGLLYAFFTSSLSSSDFVGTYFRASKLQDSYTLFLEKVIKPYRISMIALIKGESEIIEMSEPIKNSSLPDVGREECLFLLSEILDSIVTNTSIGMDLEKGLFVILEACIVALEKLDMPMLNALLTSLELLTKDKVECKRLLLQIREIIISFGVNI